MMQHSIKAEVLNQKFPKSFRPYNTANMQHNIVSRGIVIHVIQMDSS
jgi:hypothetical protein